MLRRLGLALVVVLACGMLYLLRDQEPGAPETTTTNNEQEPDVYGQNVSFNQLHADGTLHYRLRATSIRQFNSEELTRMTSPELKLLNPQEPPWDIASKLGYIRTRLSPNGDAEEVVFLREEVELIQTRADQGVVTLSSESFYIYPDRQYAETDQDVIIDTAVGRTKAAGLKADLETGVIRLSSNSNQRVHTIVLPEQFKNP
jgi:lipopolysaccharide export system protein LptC